MIILTALSTALNAQEIVTDRPDQTESSTTVPDGSFQMELGFGNGKYNDNRLSLLPSALFRYGLSEYFELRFVEQLADFTNMASQQDLGLSDIELGAKIQVLKKEGLNRLNYYLMCQTESSPENSYPQKSRGNKLLFSYDIENCILFSP